METQHPTLITFENESHWIWQQNIKPTGIYLK